MPAAALSGAQLLCVCGPYYCCTSVASLLHLCCTSVAPLLHLCCTSVSPRLHLCSTPSRRSCLFPTLVCDFFSATLDTEYNDSVFNLKFCAGGQTQWTAAVESDMGDVVHQVQPQHTHTHTRTHSHTYTLTHTHTRTTHHTHYTQTHKLTNT